MKQLRVMSNKFFIMEKHIHNIMNIIYLLVNFDFISENNIFNALHSNYLFENYIIPFNKICN